MDFDVVIDENLLQHGDLVFRQGRGMSSQFVNFADKERSYSHIGILVKDSSGWYVIHAVPGESDETDGQEFIKRDPIERFFGYDRTVEGIVVRFDLTDEIRDQVVEKTLKFYQQKRLFDHQYRLSDTTVLYCTELVYRAFLVADIDLTEGRRHAIPLFKEPIIFPSDILKNNTLQEVYTIKFIQKQ
jgi:hypothetical protein